VRTERLDLRARLRVQHPARMQRVRSLRRAL